MIRAILQLGNAASSQPQARAEGGGPLPELNADARPRSVWHWLGLIASAGISLIVIFHAVWYSSAALFPSFPYIHNDYADLGDAFLHGQLALLEEPSPQLRALPNPYDFNQRANVPYRWDASYYEGKYYLYWGPVPALISAAIEAIQSTPPSGALLVLPAYVGLVIVFFAVLVSTSWHFVSRIGSLAFGLIVAAAFINFPLLFELGQARVYEASILYGQLFLFAGLLCLELRRRSSRDAWLVGAGLAWALAAGCRYNLLIAIVIFCAFALVWIRRNQRLSWRPIACLIAPLVVAAFIGGIYNQMRFGNPFETGKNYQLTVTPPQRLEYAPGFLPSNLYIYLLYPVTTAAKFPFVKSALFDPQSVPGWVQIPQGRVFDHVIFGTLAAAPFLWLLLPALVLGLVIRVRKGASRAVADRAPGAAFDIVMIVSAAAAQFLFIAVYYYGAERFVGDFYLLFMLALGLALLRADASPRIQPWLRTILWVAAAGLAMLTIGMGYFGAFSVPPKTFNASNPVLYTHLASYWNDRFETLQLILNRLDRLAQVLGIGIRSGQP